MRLVEDCALSLYSRDPSGRWLGSTGDLSIFCLYKTLPVPHGGVALGPALPTATPPDTLSTWHHLGGSLLTRAELFGGRAGRLVRQLVRQAVRRSVDRVAR